MRRGAVLLTAVALGALLAACSALPGSSPRPTAVVSTTSADPYGLASVPWPTDVPAATAWLGRLPGEVEGMTKVSDDQADSSFDFVLYRLGSQDMDRSVGWFEGGGLDALLGVLDFDDGAQPCDGWESSPSLTPLAGTAGDDLRTATRALPDTLPEAVPWWSCTFTHDDTGEALDEADWEWFATWVSGDRSFTVSASTEAERDALVRAAVQAAAG